MVPSFFWRCRVESMLYAAGRRRAPLRMRAALLVVVLSVLGAGVSSPAGAQSSSNGFVPGEAERELALKSEAAQRLTQRDDPGRRQARLRSRSALRGASRAELLQAGRLHFADVFT